MNFTPTMASRIEMWPLERLKPYDRNARTHSEAQIAELASSIVEYGFISPMLVSGEGEVMAGHGRLAAAKKLGLESVPVVVLDHLTPTQRRAYIIADNRLAEAAGWNEELLASELAALSEGGFDLERRNNAASKFVHERHDRRDHRHRRRRRRSHPTGHGDQPTRRSVATWLTPPDLR